MSELPKFEALMLPILRLIAQGRPTIAEGLPSLQTLFGLTDAQMAELLPSGKQTTISNRAHWARNYMKHAGLVEPVKRGHYRITSEGQALLDSGPTHIDKTVLEQFPAYREWQKLSQPGLGIHVAAEPAEATTETPEERIEHAWHQLDSALVEELLETVRTLTPTRFEQLIVELLLAMGYGDGRAEMGRAIGKSGDGGIDGVVNEDKLGLDAVYIQAKRYAANNIVGSPHMNAFIGAMIGQNATKGVFVTTSSFTQPARDYLKAVKQRVVLIDGQRLVRLMIDHGVGVVVKNTYVLHRIDENFFTDEA